MTLEEVRSLMTDLILAKRWSIPQVAAKKLDTMER